MIYKAFQIIHQSENYFCSIVGYEIVLTQSVFNS